MTNCKLTEDQTPIAPTQVTPAALLDAAAEAAKRAYAPYSNFPVGAALLLRSGDIISGCNVENASYGLTNCAERTALFSAVSQGFTANDFVALAVWAEQTPYHAVTPCGACRQVLAELLAEDVPVYLYNPAGELMTLTVGTLLPHRFKL